ncbi:MAG: DUF4131 domain-containing protein, partial [Planctomycetes bacterium]|nr:DUF4131 domain-containing protein [Planctomycetota bacterium]
MALGLIGGIVLDAHWTLSRWTYGALFLAASVVAVSRRVRMASGALLVLIASLCIGGVLHAGTREVSATSIERYTTDAKRLVRIRGVVMSKPRLRERPDTPFKRWTFGSDRTVFLLEVASIQGEKGPIEVSGRIHVTIDEAVLDLREDE